jgi:hypothetical protein
LRQTGGDKTARRVTARLTDKQKYPALLMLEHKGRSGHERHAVLNNPATGTVKRASVLFFISGAGYQ